MLSDRIGILGRKTSFVTGIGSHQELKKKEEKRRERTKEREEEAKVKWMEERIRNVWREERSVRQRLGLSNSCIRSILLNIQGITLVV